MTPGTTDELPDALKRYPTGVGQAALAARLGLTINPFSQDWEWEVADPARFSGWVRVYREEALSDDERFSLMEMLIQCVDDIAKTRLSGTAVEQLPEWQAVASLLLERPRLHASSIAYWALPGHGDDPDELFAVSAAMRKVWTQVRPGLESWRDDGE